VVADGDVVDNEGDAREVVHEEVLIRILAEVAKSDKDGGVDR